MKNIYNDTPRYGENVNSGSFEFPGDEKKEPPKAPVITHHTSKGAEKKEKPEHKAQPAEPEQPQPQQYAQPPQYAYVQMPYYYVPPAPYQQVPYQPGYQQPIPVQMTPEQYAAFIQQYPPQQYPAQSYGYPPQYAAPQPAPEQTNDGAIDSGRRVLYQSVDFDKPLSEPEESYDDFSGPLEDEKPSEEKASTKESSSKVPSYEEEPFIIEEETVEMPERKPDAPPKPSMKVEEMEMSTFELNAILGRQQFTQANAAPKAIAGAKKTTDVPLHFGTSFQVEETVNEVMTDISSDSEPEKKKLPVSEIIRRVILGVSLIAIVIAAGMLLNEYRLSKENDNLEEGISDLIISVPEDTTTEKSDGDKDEDKEATKPTETTTAPLTPEQQWAQIQAEYPNLIFPQGIQLKYAKLYATNRDFVGYLEANGINMSLPIVQTDNDSDYLNKNFYGKKTKYGCPFVTHLNNIIELDQNTVIFGHHMNNGTVFGALDEYKTIDGFKAAPVITFNTLYKDYSWKVIAAFVTNAYEKDDNGYVFRYYFTQLSTQDRFAAYLNELSQRSLYDTGIDVLPTDKLLTLSTCSHEFEDARFVVVARLIRPGESTDVDVSKATVNPSPRYPQAYYSKKKLTNPYENAYRWEVG